MNATKLAKYGMLVALSLVLGYVESLVPAFFALPGMKLGLTNIVVLYALYAMGEKSAVCINIVRILLSGFLFGNGASIIYSLAGGLLSGAVMIILKRCTKLGIVTVSVAGGVAHNLGQILVAMALLRTASLAWYLAVLWLAGIAAGAVVGIIGGAVIKRLEGTEKSP